MRFPGKILEKALLKKKRERESDIDRGGGAKKLGKLWIEHFSMKN